MLFDIMTGDWVYLEIPTMGNANYPISGNTDFEGILPKGPYLPCASMAGRALLEGYPCFDLGSVQMCINWLYTPKIGQYHIISIPPGAEARKFWEKWVNTMTADALAPCVARSLTAMALNWLFRPSKQAWIFHNEIFQLPVLSQCQDTIEETK